MRWRAVSRQKRSWPRCTARSEGCSRGRGGSMHLFDAAPASTVAMPSSAAGCRWLLGWRWRTNCMGRPQVTACFFGEGAVAEGEFHESMNLAALWKLPVLFCCENNLYAMGTALGRSESETDIALKAAAFEMPAWPVDGMDVVAVEDATKRAAIAVRAGGGPHFLEYRTYRFRAHSMYDPELYRDKQEVEEWKKRDPIAAFAQRMKEQNLWKEEDWARMEEGVAAEIAKAVDFAEAGTWEPLEELTRFVYSEGAAGVQSSKFNVQSPPRP